MAVMAVEAPVILEFVVGEDAVLKAGVSIPLIVAFEPFGDLGIEKVEIDFGEGSGYQEFTTGLETGVLETSFQFSAAGTYTLHAKISFLQNDETTWTSEPTDLVLVIDEAEPSAYDGIFDVSLEIVGDSATREDNLFEYYDGEGPLDPVVEGLDAAMKIAFSVDLAWSVNLENIGAGVNISMGPSVKFYLGGLILQFLGHANAWYLWDPLGKIDVNLWYKRFLVQFVKSNGSLATVYDSGYTALHASGNYDAVGSLSSDESFTGSIEITSDLVMKSSFAADIDLTALGVGSNVIGVQESYETFLQAQCLGEMANNVTYVSIAGMMTVTDILART